MKILVLCSILIIGSGISYGQTPLGIKGGIQSSALTREGSVLDSDALGFMVGMFFHPISKHPVTGEFEILITRKGSAEYRATYLEVPLLVNFKIADHFFFGAGGYVAAKLGDKIPVPTNPVTVPEFEASFQFIDAGYIAELGYWKESLEIGIRFEKALTNSFTLNGLNFNNRVWALYVGYHL